MIAHLNVPRFTERARCAETDPEMFFPESYGRHRKVRAVCRACPAAAECLRWALDNDEPDGIWGGLTPLERRKLRRGVAA